MGRRALSPRVEHRGTRYIVLCHTNAISVIEQAKLDGVRTKMAMYLLGDEMKRAQIVFEQQTGFVLHFIPGQKLGFIWGVKDKVEQQRHRVWLEKKARKMDDQIVSILRSAIELNLSSTRPSQIKS